MKKYKATKIVEAEKITTFSGGVPNVAYGIELMLENPKGNPQEGDYLVKYDNSDYVAWCPKEIFEKHNSEFSNGEMSFGDAIAALKCNHKVARKGWNGKGMFLYLVEGCILEKQLLRGAASEALKDTLKPEVKICSHIDMKAADGSIVVGWLASQTDMLSNDWMIVD